MSRRKFTPGLLVVFLLGSWLFKLGFYHPIFPGSCVVSISKPEYPRDSVTLMREEVVELNHAWRWGRHLEAGYPKTPPEYVIKGGKNEVRVWRSQAIASDKDIYFRLTPAACQCLDLPITRLENQLADHYGELVPWSEAKIYFPMFSKAEVMDIDTGKSFRVQRRGGYLHADVQPLTAEDSHIMKSIYGGHWSWNRRAVIVVIGGQRMAASMNGKPHGAGAIANNDFDGHFCIHFWHSRVHASGKEDPIHKQMILKAAGKN